MGDRRKRKSLWDVDEDPRNFSRMNEHGSWAGREPHHSHHDSRRYHNFSGSRGYSATKSRENTGQGYWEPVVEESGSLMKGLRQENGGETRYFQNMSPGFDRHFERSRSRSRSRSRTRGRSHSRSLSRGRTSERERSRNRSRGNGGAMSQLRSHSPTGDSWKSSSWSDRRSVLGNASQEFKDFSSGRSRKDSWESKDDPYRRGDERSPNRSSHTVPCREFVKGRCRWGDDCRFSHHVVSDENFGKGPGRNLSDMDIQHQSYRDTRPFCKFFAAGKCDRSNCRFSHEDSRIGILEGRTAGAIDDKGHDSRSGHGLENDDMSVEIPEWIPAPIRDTGFNGERAGASVPHIDKSSAKKLASPLEGQLQSHERNRETEVPDSLPEHAFAIKDWHQNIAPGSLLRPENPGAAERAAVGSYQSDFTSERKELKKTDLDVGRVLTQNSSSLNQANGTHSGYYPNPSNGFCANFSEANVTHLNLLSQIQCNENAVQMAGISAMKAPQLLPNSIGTLLTNVPAAIVDQNNHVAANHSTLPMQSIEKELPHKNTVIDAKEIFGNSSLIDSASAQSNLLSTTMENGSSRNSIMQQLQPSLISNAGTGPAGVKTDCLGSPEQKQEKESAKLESTELSRPKLEKREGDPEMKQSEAHDELGGYDDIVPNKDDKGVRLFRNSLVELVKDILRPTWKEGKLSREVHKTVVKKVVGKVTSTIQADHIPKTQDKIDQYLKYSKTKITKLVQAYVGRSLKKDT